MLYHKILKAQASDCKTIMAPLFDRVENFVGKGKKKKKKTAGYKNILPFPLFSRALFSRL